MRDLWHSAGGLERLATGLLVAALAGLAVTYAANQKSVAIQGPGALQAIDDTIWLGVNEELWVLDRAGHRIARRSARDLGFTEAVSNIVPAPGGKALLTSRGDRDWQLVDRRTLARVGTIAPQWPDDFRDNYLRAIHLAIAPDGDIAVATGGGHAVLLFDAQGRYKTRTRGGTYRFTNGLWWSPDGWWTTDTNRFVLRLLDAGTLAVSVSLPLLEEPRRYPFLGESIPSQGEALPGTQQLPLATVSRLGTLMEPGHAVDVFPDGSQAVYNREPFAELRDMAWFDGQLLLVDGGNYEIARFAPDRTAAAPFGDAQVRAELRQMREDRAFWRTLGSRYALFASLLLLVAGIGTYARQRRVDALDRIALRTTGRTVEAAREPQLLLRERLRIFGVPIAVRLCALALALFAVFPWLNLAVVGRGPMQLGLSLRLLALCVIACVAPVAIWQRRRHARLAREPELEATLNHRAIAWLRSHDDWDRVREDGETPRETVYLPGWNPRWLLVTSRRILLFAASGRDRRLQRQWPRRAVVAAAPEPLQRRPAWLRAVTTEPNLCIAFSDGSSLSLRCASTVTAERVAQLLQAGATAAGAVPTSLAATRRRWHEVLASLVVPGTGQWLQGRFATGAVLFTGAVLLTLFDWGPVAWASHGPKMEVSPLAVAAVAMTWVLFALVAAGDAWRFSAALPARR